MCFSWRRFGATKTVSGSQQQLTALNRLRANSKALLAWPRERIGKYSHLKIPKRIRTRSLYGSIRKPFATLR